MLLLLAATLAVAEVRPDAPPPAASLTAEQQERLEDRENLFLEAKNFWRQGRFDKAIAAGEKILALERDVLGPQHEDVVRSLEFLARLQESRRDYAAGHARRQEILDIQVKRYGEDHWRARDARLALARADRVAGMTRDQRRRLEAADEANGGLERSYRFGLSADAVDTARQVLEVRELLLGADDPDALTARNNLGMVYCALGDYASGEPYLRQALEGRRRVLGEDHPSCGASLNNLGLLDYYRGDYRQAEPRLTQAARIMEQQVGAGKPAHAVALNNLAILYGAMGDYARAQPLLDQAVQASRQAKDAVAAETARPVPYGMYQAVMGDYNWTDSLTNLIGTYVSPLEADEPPEVWNTPIYLSNLAGLYLVLGEDKRAEPLLREAIDLIESDHDLNFSTNRATALGNLALLYFRRKDYDEAERLLLRVLEIRKAALSEGGPRHPKVATTLNNLGLVSFARGDFARAEAYWREALKLREAVLGKEHPSCALILGNLAAARDAQGDPAEAAALLKRALDVARSHLEESFAVQGERQQVRLTEAMRGLLDQYLSVAPRAKSPPTEVYPYLLAWKGAVFARQALARRAADSADPKTAVSVAELRQVTQRLTNLAFAAPEPGQRGDWQMRLADLTRRKEELETDLASRIGRAPAPPTVDRLQAALPRDGALVDFLEYIHSAPPEGGKGKLQKEQRLVAFVVRPGAEVRRIDLGPAAPVTAAVDRWRKTLGRRPPDADDDPGADLRRLAWQPLEDALKGVQLAAVSPDGALGRFPLAALPGSKPGTFLVEDRALVLVPAPQLLPETLAADPPGGDPSMLLVGDVDYDSPAGRPTSSANEAWAARGTRAGAPFTWPALPGTKAELIAIKELFTKKFPEGGLAVLQGDGATEAGMRKEATARRWLHIATHGFFAPAQLHSVFAGNEPADASAPPLLGRGGLEGFHPGLLSGVVLAGANRKPESGQDDGILTALEVASLDLHRVDLAVLSACETGLGQEAGGEGMLGLQRAFQVAGARTTVTSLWQVSDDPTRLLMERFYSNLWDKKMSKVEALREAQLWMLREGRADKGVQRGFVADQDKGWDQEGRMPPYYWAAFVLSGDWR